MTHAWNLAPLAAGQKKVVGAFLLVFALAFANESFDWRIVGDYDWEAIVVLTLVGLVLMAYSIRSARRR